MSSRHRPQIAAFCAVSVDGRQAHIIVADVTASLANPNETTEPNGDDVVAPWRRCTTSLHWRWRRTGRRRALDEAGRAGGHSDRRWRNVGGIPVLGLLPSIADGHYCVGAAGFTLLTMPAGAIRMTASRPLRTVVSGSPGYGAALRMVSGKGGAETIEQVRRHGTLFINCTGSYSCNWGPFHRW